MWPKSSGIADSFVKTIKRKYVAFMPTPDAETAARSLVIGSDQSQREHPHNVEMPLASRIPALDRFSNFSVTL
jgi:putative transposase